MELRLEVGDILDTEADCIVVNLLQGVTEPGGATGAVDQAMGGVIKQLIEDGDIKGKAGELTLVHTQGKIKPKRVVVAGLGKQDKMSTDTLRSLGGDVARFARGKGFSSVASIIHGAGIGGMDPEAAGQAFAEGVSLGLYRFRRHFSKQDDDDDDSSKEISEFTLVEQDAARAADVRAGIERANALSDATALARDLANEPANYMTPTMLADRARAVAESSGLDFEQFDRAEMERRGMGALLGVARGSHQPPQFIIMRYRGDPENAKKTVGLLGKGITFDSGGISLKPPANMGEMKGDMAGGASVIAAMQAIAKLEPAINVTGIVPATENLPGGGATKPGDVLVAMNKKTIEVENTDAEGRLVLADALSYANAEGMSPLVDVATLTGAIRVALGTVTIGLFANDDDVAERAFRAGERAGEKIWRMPLWDDYKEQNKSRVADVKNTGGQPAGAITAAQFLHEFAGDTPWAHLDIAGVMNSDKDKGWQVRGASGKPVRTLVNFVLDLAGEG
jgi:leucyl aminopeptidase